MGERSWGSLAGLAVLALAGGGDPVQGQGRGTFSIVAYDSAAAEWGVAVASKFPAVGADVPWARAGVGAIATQALANISYGPRGLAMLEMGFTAQEVIDKLTALDPGREDRQVGIVDARGNAATFTGTGCFPWAGGVTGRHYACQGNILAGEGVVRAMAGAFEGAAGSLAHRLMAALEAGDRAGGDRRGKESAALLVVREKGGYGGYTERWLDLRVDDHSEPVQELRRLLGIHELYFGPTDPTRLMRLDAPLTREIQRVLKRLGYYKGEIDGVYDEETRKALSDFMGWENLEMRFRQDDQIDGVVVDYIRSHYGRGK